MGFIANLSRKSYVLRCRCWMLVVAQGRFAIDLIELGAHVTLVELSSVQLDLARRHLSDANLLQRITALQQGDITRLDKIDDSTFDVTICYGSTISYTCQEFPRALKELRRVTRPGGHIIASVTSLFGSLRLVGPPRRSWFYQFG